MSKVDQNDISLLRLSGVNLNTRWKSILDHITSSVPFSPNEKSIKNISWWNTGKVGSVSILGTLKISSGSIPCLLKIQGSKPKISEAENIKAFALQNKSKIIRPPKIYRVQKWDNDLQYEASIQEIIHPKYLINSRPSIDIELSDFFYIYEEYRDKCRNKPWLRRPAKQSYSDKIKIWLDSVAKDRKKDKYGTPSDIKLMDKAIRLVDKNLRGVDLEFMHGHLAINDFLCISQSEIVLTSNLFWGWRNPFYDAVFAYHWWMLGMEHAKDLTSQMLDTERARWLDKIFNLNEVKSKPDGERLINVALLERAIPALVVDRFMTDQDSPGAEIIARNTRTELSRLVKYFQ